ncbi:MAG: hypothetical protein ABL869_06200 [Candidatus Nitrotoga sp.]
MKHYLFSVDWELLVNGEFKRASCGTSLDAASVILDEAATLHPIRVWGADRYCSLSGRCIIQG